LGDIIGGDEGIGLGDDVIGGGGLETGLGDIIGGDDEIGLGDDVIG
jgi:hypothetical protein